MQKVGMTLDATLKNYSTNNDGEVIDVDMYSITDVSNLK
jgi:hypothetical protein